MYQGACAATTAALELTFDLDRKTSIPPPAAIPDAEKVPQFFRSAGPRFSSEDKAVRPVIYFRPNAGTASIGVL